jgi:hypothetical protein
MNTLPIIALSLYASIPTEPIDFRMNEVGARQPMEIRVAQTQSTNCCRQWNSRIRTWLEIGTDKEDCIRLNERLDRSERNPRQDVLERNGYIWWDERCDNEE